MTRIYTRGDDLIIAADGEPEQTYEITHHHGGIRVVLRPRRGPGGMRISWARSPSSGEREPTIGLLGGAQIPDWNVRIRSVHAEPAADDGIAIELDPRPSELIVQLQQTLPTPIDADLE